MKRKYIKKTVSVVLSVLLIFTLAFGISAHEMYSTNTGIPIVLKWNNTLNGKAFLQINGTDLNNTTNGYDYSQYLDQYNGAKNAWHNCANLVTIESSTSNPTVKLIVPSTSQWQRLVTENYIYSTLGCTLNKASNGVLIYDRNDALNSSRSIVSAVIYMNPYNYVFEDANEIRSVMVHELGHVLCLGHPNGSYNNMSVASVMNQGQAIYTIPQSHDISDILNKYG